MTFLDKIFDKVDSNELIGLNNELKSIYIYEKFKNSNNSVILVTSNLHEAGLIYNSLTHYTDKVWFFPMDDFITSVAIATSPEFKITRLETMNSVIAEKKAIIITNLMGYLRFLPSKEKFKNSKINLKIGDSINLDKLIEKLFNLGYKRETTVNMTGEIAVRGYVIDIFPINSDNPIRIEFWGDEIDSIRIFSIDSQLTISKIDEVTIFPNTETLLEKYNFEAKHKEMQYEKDITNIAGYLNNPLTIYNNFHNLMVNYDLLLDEMKNYSISIDLPMKTKYMFDFENVKDKNAIIFEEFQNTKENKAKVYTKVDIENFPKEKTQINDRLNTYLKSKKKVIICLDNRYKVNKFIEFLENDNLVFTNENEIFPGKLNIIVKKINGGFITDDYIVITEKELWGKNEENSYRTKFKYGTRIKDITKLEIGDYVVHGIHGIGRYDGLKTIIKNGLKKDYLTITYRDNDKLYIPVEKLDLITKYSSGDSSIPKLNKLGSHEWQKTKAKARKHAEDIAEDLLKM